MNTITDTMVWHNDGHAMHLRLDKDQLSIIQVDCPGTEECQINSGCIVTWFLNRYGLECNVGIASPSAIMQIAWSISGDNSDPDLCQVWVIPIDDEAFAAWLMTVEK